MEGCAMCIKKLLQNIIADVAQVKLYIPILCQFFAESAIGYCLLDGWKVVQHCLQMSSGTLGSHLNVLWEEGGSPQLGTDGQ